MDDGADIALVSARVENHVHSQSTSPPMLGDFTKLQHRAGSRLEPPLPPGATAGDASCLASKPSGAPIRPSSNPSVRLGDFCRILAQLRTRTTATMEAPVAVQEACSLTPPCSSPACSTRCASAAGSHLHVHCRAEDAVEDNLLTPPTSPPASTHSLAPPKAVLARPPQPQMRRSDVGPVLSYQLSKNGPLVPIPSKPRSKDDRLESLSLRLGPLGTMDRLMAVRHPHVTSHGIHVFLDMSNINISFHHTLRARYSLHENARLVPLPPLDLQFLTEILVRGRRVVALNAGCSVLPGRPEARYIQQLRHLGYHVDVRERKPVTRAAKPRRMRAGATGASSSSDETSYAAGTVRYLEDLVDETLQTRIAESVMKCFREQGTLVVATGDAQPAKYSDGFLAYVERALEMGWHVEVVSWKKSLSSAWKKPESMSRWGDRFRVIELDDFMHDLLACCV